MVLKLDRSSIHKAPLTDQITKLHSRVRTVFSATILCTYNILGDPEVTAQYNANQANLPIQIRKIIGQICGSFWVIQQHVQ